MLKIDILSVLPELLEGPFAHSIMKRAQEKGLLQVNVHSLRKWAINKHGQIDDYQYGGGAGMVILCETLANAIDELQAPAPFDEIIFMTPDGVRFNQSAANQLSLKGNILIICGHYKGIDERIRKQYVTQEISIGDYVLSGGELDAAVVVDAVGRLIRGVLIDDTHELTDFYSDYLIAPPGYPQPADLTGDKVTDEPLQGEPKKVYKDDILP